MPFSKLSALRIFLVAITLLGVLSGTTSVIKAAEITPGPAPDWIRSPLTIDTLTDHTWVDGDQYRYGNIPCTTIGAYSWGTQSNGWFSWNVKTMQNACVTMGASTYIGWRDVLPFGSEYWQYLDVLSGYYNPSIYPNPGTNGLALMTNSYRPYSSSPTELYYTSNVLETFNQFSKDGNGNIIRSPSKPFDHKLTYPDGRTFDLHNAGGISYSANGRWMYLNVQTVGQLRIHTSDLSAFSFDPGISSYYALYTAISNSGNTAATYSYDQGLKLYDLTQCEGEKPEYGSRDCASRDIPMTSIREKVLEKVPDQSQLGQVAITEIKFLTDAQLRLLVQYVHNGENKYMFMQLAVNPGQTTTRYLALGDSFSSGEGIFTYRTETNFYNSSTNYNICHTSTWSYPYIVSANVKPSWMNSVACSGAKTRSIASSLADDRFMNSDDTQAKGNLSVDNIRSSILPGYISQNSMVSSLYPNVATLTIGGNDISFGGILYECITQAGCFSSRDEREAKADEIDQWVPKWTRALQDIEDKMDWRRQKLYVIGYPKIVNDTNTNCSLIGKAERQRINALEDYLNEAIRTAAVKVGAVYIDVSDAFYSIEAQHDRRLCGDGPLAVNGFLPNFYADEHGSAYPSGDLFAHESYHPNLIGHVLLAQRLMTETNDFQLEKTLVISGTTQPSSTVRHGFVGDEDDLMHGISNAVNMTTTSVVKGATAVVNFSTDVASKVSGALSLHSDTIDLGNFTTDELGNLTTTVTIPTTAPTGFHKLEFTYTDADGVQHSLYEYLYVAASSSDYDGDGIPNNQETCVVGGTLGSDMNSNGIDDACDSLGVKQNVTTSEVSRIVASGTVTNEDYEKLTKLSSTDQTSQANDDISQISPTDAKTNGSFLGDIRVPLTVRNLGQETTTNSSPQQVNYGLITLSIFGVLGVGAVLVLKIRKT